MSEHIYSAYLFAWLIYETDVANIWFKVRIAISSIFDCINSLPFDDFVKWQWNSSIRINPCLCFRVSDNLRRIFLILS